MPSLIGMIRENKELKAEIERLRAALSIIATGRDNGLTASSYEEIARRALIQQLVSDKEKP